MASHKLRWLCNGASAWAIAFGAPHLWWALGVRYGFPGGDASYDRFMGSAWRFVYDCIVVVCSVLAVAIARTLMKPPAGVVRRWIPMSLAWFACAILLVRGVGGHIIDGTSDLVWAPMFTLGGLLMGGVAWTARVPQTPE